MITRCLAVCGLGLLVVLGLSTASRGNAFVRGAYYRLGENDPGAVNGAVGNDPTIDSFTDHLDLTRFGLPHYTNDVPPQGPVDDKLALRFGSIVGPTIIGFYGRSKSLAMDQQGYALETWVRFTPSIGDAAARAESLIAYNGTPGTDGFGFYQDGGDYVARVGAFDRVLGSADTAWHHLAYVYTSGTEDYYYDGNLVLETTKDPAPVAATGGFWIAGHGALDNADSLFNGVVDEVRYQSFNPMAAGAFDPTSFLITLPEPASGCVLALGAVLLLARRW